MYDKNGKFYKPDRGSGECPDHIMISFCGDAKTEMAVSWRCDASVNCGYVLYGEKGKEFKRADAVVRKIESDIDISNFFTVNLKDLKAGTKYYYTCGDHKNRSEEFSFTTQEENCDSFKFMVISDQQVGEPWEKPDYSSVTQMLKNALNRDKDIRFILTAGDNCDDGQNELQWNGMFEGFNGIIESVPYMMATGNHDNRGFKEYLPYPPKGKFYLDHADFFDDQFMLAYPQNGPKGFETENYSFDYGNVHFCIMGINEPQIVSDWAYDDINKSDKTWKLGAYHFPIYPAIPEGQNDDGYPWLRKAIESLDMVFEGHEHSFARTYPIRDDAMFERPSQGTVHYQCGNGSGGRHANERKMWHTAFYTQEEGVAVYALVEVNKSALKITTILDDGRIADEVVIDKENDKIQPPSLPPVYHNTRMAYKGSMPQICVRGTKCENVDGVWFAPFAPLAQYIGAKVEKDEKSAAIEMFGITAKFFEGEDYAEVDGKKIDLGKKVYRSGGQLMMPAEKAGAIFDIRCKYIEYNNLLDFESVREESPLSVQP